MELYRKKTETNEKLPIDQIRSCVNVCLCICTEGAPQVRTHDGSSLCVKPDYYMLQLTSLILLHNLLIEEKPDQHILHQRTHTNQN